MENRHRLLHIAALLCDSAAKSKTCAKAAERLDVHAKGETMRDYNIRLDNYGISRARYKELMWACRQYNEREKKIRELYGLHAVANDGMPHGTAVGNPTQQSAEAILKLLEKQQVIEQAAQAADPAQWRALLKGVTQGVRFEELPYYGGRNQFFSKRRKFFYLLDKMY